MASSTFRPGQRCRFNAPHLDGLHGTVVTMLRPHSDGFNWWFRTATPWHGSNEWNARKTYFESFDGLLDI